MSFDGREHCDKCGRYVNPKASGVSWSRQWSYDMGGTPDLHDETYRCSPCTDIHGVKATNCVGSGYNGRNAALAEGNGQEGGV